VGQEEEGEQKRRRELFSKAWLATARTCFSEEEEDEEEDDDDDEEEEFALKRCSASDTKKTRSVLSPCEERKRNEIQNGMNKQRKGKEKEKPEPEWNSKEEKSVGRKERREERRKGNKREQERKQQTEGKKEGKTNKNKRRNGDHFDDEIM
jgi:hypothetical protein